MTKKYVDTEKWGKELFSRTEGYTANIRKIYRQNILQIADLCKNVKLKDDVPFTFADYGLETKAGNILKSMYSSLNKEIRRGCETEWDNANINNDSLVSSIFGKAIAKNVYAKYFDRNGKALKTFLSRKTGKEGLDLSARVWNLTKQHKTELEDVLELTIGEGAPANSMATKIQKYLQEPNKYYRRFVIKTGKDKNGNSVYGRIWKRRTIDKETGLYQWIDDDPKRYHPGIGVYRSSYRNAQRLARTETNIAYRSSDWERIQNFDFVTGIEIKLSNNHPEPDICDDLKGIYPKWFKWTGWHPNCYSDDSYVLTSRGWMLFENVSFLDLILSLNPETKEPEWTRILMRQKYKYNGEMVHFSNRSLDCLVTPDHPMIYLNKWDGKIKKCKASEYNKNKGGFYRSSEYSGIGKSVIKINNCNYNLKTFAEFMGYWLSDGSLIRNYQITIAQQKGDKNKINIIKCIENLGFKTSVNFSTVSFYSKGINKYLKKFKTSYYKYIPDEIKNSSKEIIKVFLDAFISCDGHKRKNNSFMGNRGTIFNPQKDERTYFTTSPKMASDIGELILKSGRRPSYYVYKSKGRRVKFKNGIYTTNHDLIKISECISKSATVFEKEIINYNGYVYDITLERNHIMYICRNGKCFWGSNCCCYQVSIIASQDEIDKMTEAIIDGSEPYDVQCSGEVDKYPSNFRSWLKTNKKRIKEASVKGTLPYFIKDNKKTISIS